MPADARPIAGRDCATGDPGSAIVPDPARRAARLERSTGTGDGSSAGFLA